jgi:hypothetical protein
MGQPLIVGCDQIGLVAVEPGRLLMLQIEQGRVREACLISEEQVLLRLSRWRGVPVLLDESTAHLAARLLVAGFRLSSEPLAAECA